MLRWPKGARVAVWVIPNIEFFALDEAVPVSAGGSGKVPDVPGFAVRDYGNRIGVFRIMETLDRHGMRGTVALNSDLIAHHPAIIEEGNKLGWEWMAHGTSNSILINKQSEAEERALIRESVSTITKSTGKAPRGWLSPALSETVRTLDILADGGQKFTVNILKVFHNHSSMKL